MSGASHGMRIAKNPGSYMRRDDAVNSGCSRPCRNVRSTISSDSSSCWWLAISTIGPRRTGRRPHWRTRMRSANSGWRMIVVSSTSPTCHGEYSGARPTRSTMSEPIAKHAPAVANSQR